MKAAISWRCCDATSCRAAGAAALRQSLVAQHGVERGTASRGRRNS
jgi:NADH:ubiquinone oxidoreductase subunit E